ncbi:hypothetical protein Gotur_023251, partial [Gossypium turneri]
AVECKSAPKAKKVLVGNDHIFYARFQYEKLSMFCYICGKLGHSESFCLLYSMSRWLREANGSVCRNLDKKSRDNRRNGPRFGALLRDSVNQKNMDREMGNWAVNVSGPIDLILEEENDPLLEKRVWKTQ